MDFENSQTKKNLETAFAGESQAHTKYRYYASKAKKDGYVQISNIFAETAGNESEHAKLWFKYLHDGAVPDTLDNLRDAAAGENYEWTTTVSYTHLDVYKRQTWVLPVRRCWGTTRSCFWMTTRPSSMPTL